MYKMWPLLRACVLVIGLSLLLGCASVEKQMERLYEDIGQGSHAISGVSVKSSGGGTTITSAIRGAGPDRVTLSAEDLVVIDSESSPWGRLELSAPVQVAAEAKAYIASDDFSKYRPFAEAALQTQLATMEFVNTRELILKTIMMPEGRGFIYRMDEPLTDDQIVVAVGSAPLNTKALNWWLAFSDISAHELAHINHRLDAGESIASNVNSEAAAEIVGGCAEIRFYEPVAKENDVKSIRTTFQDQGFVHAFPGIENGEFRPRMKDLEVLEHYTTKGKVLAAAAMHTFTRDGYVDFDDVEMMRSINSYCAHIANHIPSFDEGEMY